MATADNVKMLKVTLTQVDAAAKQVKKDIAADPKKLGELAGKGLSLNQVEDVVPVGLSLRAARALLQTVIALAGDGETGSAVVDAAGDQSAEAAASAAQVSGAGEPDKNDEEVPESAPTYVQVVKGGNRKQRRAAAKGKGPAVV